MHIRKAMPDDIDELKQLYFDTIVIVNKKDYTEEQVQAWASTAYRSNGLLKRMNEQYFFVAESEDKKIIGFASLAKSGYLDLLYVHKYFQRRGVAKQLLQKITDTAIELNISRLETDASITAKPFFEKHNFTTIRQQTVTLGNIDLINYKMEGILYLS